MIEREREREEGRKETDFQVTREIKKKYQKQKSNEEKTRGVTRRKVKGIDDVKTKEGKKTETRSKKSDLDQKEQLAREGRKKNMKYKDYKPRLENGFQSITARGFLFTRHIIQCS